MDEKRQQQKERAARGEDEDEDEEEEDTSASRLVTRLLKFLFLGREAKDKVIRFRVVQCIAEMVSHLGEVE